MRKFLLYAMLAALVTLAACSFLHKPVGVIVEFLRAVDAQIVNGCEAGWMPTHVCEEWSDLKGRWSTERDRVLDFIKRLLSGELGKDVIEPGYVVAPSSTAAFSDLCSAIINAAQDAVAADELTTEEYYELVEDAATGVQ